nr:family 1 glycosylhydrolase [Dehalococcoidia bacterium]
IGYAMTPYGWAVTPEALYWGPRFFWERYKLPIIITESGMANVDWVSLDGRVHDPQRIDFLNRYLLKLQQASGDGVDICGYFQWSLLDNFEWAEGYKQRFGLVYVDYPTQKRILKDSAYWYKEVIASNGANLGEP